jgi:hypothetical protein
LQQFEILIDGLLQLPVRTVTEKTFGLSGTARKRADIFTGERLKNIVAE